MKRKIKKKTMKTLMNISMPKTIWKKRVELPKAKKI
jgi:hypothetical protein